MGTNYYAIPKLVKKEKEILIKAIEDENYGLAYQMIPEKIHIGKSSAGWQFIFDHQNWEHFKKEKKSVEDFLGRCKIIDEYGRTVTTDEFWEMIEAKSKYKHDGEYSDKIDGLWFSRGTDFC